MSCQSDMHTKSNSADDESLGDHEETFFEEEVTQSLVDIQNDIQNILAQLRQFNATLSILSQQTGNSLNSVIQKRSTSTRLLSSDPTSTSSVSIQSTTPTRLLAAISPTDTTKQQQNIVAGDVLDQKLPLKPSHAQTIQRPRLKPVSVHLWSQQTTSALSTPSTVPQMAVTSVKSLVPNDPLQHSTHVTPPPSQPSATQVPLGAELKPKS